jgi:hypothetical protein
VRARDRSPYRTSVRFAGDRRETPARGATDTVLDSRLSLLRRENGWTRLDAVRGMSMFL